MKLPQVMHIRFTLSYSIFNLPRFLALFCFLGRFSASAVIILLPLELGSLPNHSPEAKFNRKFWLEKQLTFWLEIPKITKKLKNG